MQSFRQMASSVALACVLANAAVAADNTAEHRIRLGYFVPSDRQPVANYEQKIRVVMAVVADLYLSDLRAKGYQTEGLQFESNNGRVA